MLEVFKEGNEKDLKQGFRFCVDGDTISLLVHGGPQCCEDVIIGACPQAANIPSERVVAWEQVYDFPDIIKENPRLQDYHHYRAYIVVVKVTLETSGDLYLFVGTKTQGEPAHMVTITKGDQEIFKYWD